MKKEIFKGACTALVTPFSDGKTDYKTLKKLVDYQINHGVDALVICGTTGESPTLSALEKIRCVTAAVETADGRVPIIAGIGSNDTKASAKLSKIAAAEGADALLAVTPYYNKPSASGLTEHFRQIAEASDKPVILYNVPSRTGCDIPFDTYKNLSCCENIRAVKEASGNVSKAAHFMAEFGDRYDLYSGNDDIIVPLLSLGAKGVISVLSNIFPEEVHELCRLWFEGKRGRSLKLQLEFMPLIDDLFRESNPIPVKAAMEMMGFCKGELRLPLSRAEKETAERLKNHIFPFLGR